MHVVWHLNGIQTTRDNCKNIKLTLNQPIYIDSVLIHVICLQINFLVFTCTIFHNGFCTSGTTQNYEKMYWYKLGINNSTQFVTLGHVLWYQAKAEILRLVNTIIQKTKVIKPTFAGRCLAWPGTIRSTCSDNAAY